MKLQPRNAKTLLIAAFVSAMLGILLSRLLVTRTDCNASTSDSHASTTNRYTRPADTDTGAANTNSCASHRDACTAHGNSGSTNRDT